MFDETVTRTSIALIESEQPALLTLHLVSKDHLQHEHGPFSVEANADLEQLDSMIGDIVAAERKADPDSVVAIVSDHGSCAVYHRVYLNGLLVRAGFVTLGGGDKRVVAITESDTVRAVAALRTNPFLNEIPIYGFRSVGMPRRVTLKVRQG